MHLNRFITFGVAVVAAVNASAQVSKIRAEASAYYQGESGGFHFQEESSPFASVPAVAQARSSVIHGGDTGIGRSDRTTCWDDADAWARVVHPGQERLYSRSGGWSGLGGSPTSVGGYAEVSVISYWQATTLSDLDVPIDIFYFLDGWLFSGGHSDSTFSKVEVSVRDVFWLNRDLFSASGTIVGSNGFSSAFHTLNNGSSSTWDSAWSDTSATLETHASGGEKMWDLAYQENMQDVFLVPANIPFAIEYKIRVSTQTVGPYEIFSTSDFSETAKFSLQCDTPGVTLHELNVVPEPQSVAAIGLGSLLLLRRRKR